MIQNFIPIFSIAINLLLIYIISKIMQKLIFKATGKRWTKLVYAAVALTVFGCEGLFVVSYVNRKYWLAFNVDAPLVEGRELGRGIINEIASRSREKGIMPESLSATIREIIEKNPSFSSANVTGSGQHYEIASVSREQTFIWFTDDGGLTWRGRCVFSQDVNKGFPNYWFNRAELTGLR